MKRIFIVFLIVSSIFILFSSLILASTSISVKDYLKDKFPSIFSFYLSSLEDLDRYEIEFIDLLETLPEGEQEHYAKVVYNNGFSLDLLQAVKVGKKMESPEIEQKKWDIIIKDGIDVERDLFEDLPSLVRRIEPSVVIIYAYDAQGNLLSQGSGFFINHYGEIITNNHVIQGAMSVEVKTSDGNTYPINYIVAKDKTNDIICLSADIPFENILPLSLNDTIPEVGENIIVYGSPLGLENTVSDGIISGLRDIPEIGKIIQITAPVSPGSSGSPVLNMKGKVIGIATFQYIEGQNLNFAIPSVKINSLIFAKQNKISLAENYLGQKINPKEVLDFKEITQKANYFIGNEEYEKALPYLNDALKYDFLPVSVKTSLFGLIAFCYNELGNASEAIEAWNQAIQIDPCNAYFYVRIGGIYFSQYNFNGAIESYKKAIRIDPYNIEAHYMLGNCYLFIGDNNLVLNEYKILKELDVNKAQNLFDMIY